MDCFGTYFTHVQKALLWTWQPAQMEHTKYTAVRTKVYIQQNHSACTDEALGRVYRWGRWQRVQTRPLPLGPWPEPSACTCDPGPEPSACTCDPRKRVHSRPPDPNGSSSIIQGDFPNFSDSFNGPQYFWCINGRFLAPPFAPLTKGYAHSPDTFSSPHPLKNESVYTPQTKIHL